ncbi:MAG: cell division protein FtsL [Gammaproteobacteria bacterium]|nr:cell division protein FtsL [Gammaproteobacteria bacterium]
MSASVVDKRGVKYFWLYLALMSAVLVSAIGLVYVKHLNRQLFVDLQSLQKNRDALNVEWGQLRLEQSALATHGRVERIAHTKLDMVMPPAAAIVIVR